MSGERKPDDEPSLWSCRYRAARHIGQDVLGEIIEEDQALMAEFGAAAFAFLPGLQADVGENAILSLETAQWNWLRPLLLELRDYRNKTTGCLLCRKGDSA